MDLPLMINIPVLNEAGDINPERAIRITSNVVIEFFRKYLSSKESDLLQLSNTYPEIEILNRHQSLSKK